MYATACTTDLTVLGGILNLDLLGASYVYGFHTSADIVFAGGTTVENATGYAPRAAYSVGGSFRMTGGSLTAVLKCTSYNARGIYALEAFFGRRNRKFCSDRRGKNKGHATERRSFARDRRLLPLQRGVGSDLH